MIEIINGFIMFLIFGLAVSPIAFVHIVASLGLLRVFSQYSGIRPMEYNGKITGILWAEWNSWLGFYLQWPFSSFSFLLVKAGKKRLFLQL